MPESSFTFPRVSAPVTGQVLKAPLDFSRLPLCECGISFVSWAQERFGTVLAEPTDENLQAAIVTLTKEYRFRKYPAQSEPHPLNTCVRSVYVDVLQTLREKQEELRRHPPKNTTLKPRLYIGRKEEE